ncbi:MAG TPA: cupin domain-containing protein, partial [Mycobacteriales bacterium]|nr:cupin domain-containing protein [Mycobacteriales bacterium]
MTIGRPPLAEALNLAPHPEGGWYRQTWSTSVRSHPAGYPGERATATAIYFLLNPG